MSMHVFVTGATGWVGSEVIKDLIKNGYLVTGLVRSDDKAQALKALGAKALIASLDDLDALSRAASQADAVIHTAFNHDFSKFIESCEQDRKAIEALGKGLKEGQRLLVTSGLSGLARGATEADLPNPASPRKSEAAAKALTGLGVKAATVRLAPSVHGLGDHGFVSILASVARQKGVSAYIGEGNNCWSGVHRLDAARIYRLALEEGVTQSVYHAVADQAVSFKEIAQVIGDSLGLPVESREPEHFDWFARMAGGEMTVSSERTRNLLGWAPSGPDLLTDLKQPDYFSR